MASATDNLDPGLIAIALVVRAKEGPRFVFHYPPHPSGKPIKREARFGTELHGERAEKVNEEEDDSEDDDLEDAIASIDLSAETGGDARKVHHVEAPEGDNHFTNKKGENVAPWDHLWEFHTSDLESILTPVRAFHKKKFELSLDPVQFITYPMHIRENGTWKKKKPKKSRKEKKAEETAEGEASGEKKSSSDEGENPGGMTMFNVVFMLNVSKHEEDARIAEIYEHIIKKFNKAFNHAQASDNYVWKESERILQMKERAREELRPMSWLWNEILIKSTLAGAIRDIFNAVSKSKIATLHLATVPPINISLQIPVPCFLTSFPSSRDRAMLGLLLTSANPMVDEEGNEDPTHLNKHFALLLLDDEEKIITEIQNDNTELTAPLLQCIRLCSPNQSFLQVAQNQNVELNSLLTLAQHVIYWRRAIAIPPLHGRETYIVSPNADFRKLPMASIAWKKAFPLAPALSSYLALLSAAPRPYKNFAPSKNHRPTYLAMLAWAIRGGWVTQLRTFAWILVWPEIIYEVTYELKASAVEKAKNAPGATSGTSTSGTDESSTEKKQVDPSAPLTTSQAAEKARLERLATKARGDAQEFESEFKKLPVPVATAHPSNNNAAHLKDISPYIIKDPHKVSHEESLYIAAYGKRFEDAKLRESWFRFCGKYFNGKEALEMIPLQEGMKRKEAWAIIIAFQEMIMICKHW
ncbi:hypothetical protein HYALB_00002840 [Hymenoscyphus albidus]|uniref:Nitrogen permease regulator 3 n=1 Tax=Hymenoscyphus albidus TaxID=595503 RepID=A0A9N9PZ56_9HELO|nr:hypothetical protein HYALB_00002840 [Hymenoscyphus albidus]